MRRWALRVGVPACIGIAILGYGYWRASTRAFIRLTLIDAAKGEGTQPVFGAALIFRDVMGNALAAGNSDDRFGIVRFTHPQFGSCEEEERSASASSRGRSRWDRCIGEQFKWQTEWAPQIRSLDIEVSRCRIANVRVALQRRADDWWLWWVPLPHIGGDPLTTYSGTVSVNTDTCEARDSGVPK